MTEPELYMPKEEVYTALNALGYSCTQGSQSVFNETPAITFYISDNSPTYDLDKKIVGQEVEMTVDVWGDDSVTTTSVAQEAEDAMREIDYLLTYLADIPSPEGALYHIQMRFVGIK